MSCRHPDIRRFKGIRCCLACGEAVIQQTLATQIRTTTGSQYQYQRLNYTLGQEIRLINLLGGERSDPIRCQMLHVNLEDDPAYEAVSYTWSNEDGDVCKSSLIHFVNGNGAIAVTKNCEGALRQLRNRGCSRRLWVDAICIDQASISERNHQVGLMDRIFSLAWRVIMCIQDERPSTSIDYSKLFEILRTRKNATPSIVLTVDRLLNARYFTRVWIIQEVALARSAWLRINEQELLLSRSTLETLKSICSEHNFPIPSVLRWIPGEKSQYDIVTCLASGIESQATDPRDKVFALLSLMEPRARALLPVDYSLDVSCVHAYAMIAIITTQRSLDVLRYVDCRTQLSLEHALKTKCRQYVHFETKDTGRWRSTIGVHKLDHLVGGDFEPGANHLSMVTFERPCSTSLCGILPHFQVRAHYLDTITSSQFCDQYSSKPHPFDDGSLAWHGYTRCSGHLPETSRYLSPEDFYFYFLRTENGSAPSNTWVLEYFREHNGQVSMVNHSHMNEFTEEMHPSLSQQISTSGVRPVVFTTRYSIGRAQYGLEVGDEVFAIDGVSVPFILRNTGPQQYKLVGECYLWAALELDRWNPGTRKGRWLNDYSGCEHANETGSQTRMIEVNGAVGKGG